MSDKKRPERPSTVEIWKGIRKDPTPAQKVHKLKNREQRDVEDEDEIEQWLSWRGGKLDDWEDEV